MIFGYVSLRKLVAVRLAPYLIAWTAATILLYEAFTRWAI